MWPNPQFSTDLVTFTEEILNVKLSLFVQWVSMYMRKNTDQIPASIIDRSSCPEVFLRKGVLEICSKYTREHPGRSVILKRLL